MSRWGLSSSFIVVTGYGLSQLPVLCAGQVVFPLAGSYVVLSGCEEHVLNRPTPSRFVERNARSLVVMDEGHWNEQFSNTYVNLK